MSMYMVGLLPRLRDKSYDTFFLHFQIVGVTANFGATKSPDNRGELCTHFLELEEYVFYIMLVEMVLCAKGQYNHFPPPQQNFHLSIGTQSMEQSSSSSGQ
mmetsp:Transcript_10798/g.18007  ORF Transcript_10798/g.18007 Transcript_10798/m.18007 type:complete len:101 (-) Transcript_10798:331-633(-)